VTDNGRDTVPGFGSIVYDTERTRSARSTRIPMCAMKGVGPGALVATVTSPSMASGCGLDPPPQDATSTNIRHKLTLRKISIEVSPIGSVNGPARHLHIFTIDTLHRLSLRDATG
jgi:hypothetical protein